MPDDPRNRPERRPEADRALEPAATTPPAPASDSTAAARPGHVPDPRERPADPTRSLGTSATTRSATTPPAEEPVDAGRTAGPVGPRPTRPVLILTARSLPAGARPVRLTELAARLRQDRSTNVRVIGSEQSPDALAATLSEDEIRRITQELGDRVRVVEDTPIDL